MTHSSALSLLTEFGIDAAERSNRMSKFQVTPADLALMPELGKVLTPHLPKIVDAFYDHLGKFPEAMAIVEQAGSSITNLKKTNPAYFSEMFRGDLDDRYFANRMVIGSIHARIGVTPLFFYAAMSTYYQHVFPLVIHHYRFRPAKAAAMLTAFQKLLNLDQQLIMEVYIEHGFIGKIRSASENVSEVAGELAQSSSELRLAAEEAGRATQEVAHATQRFAFGAQEQANSAERATEVIHGLAQENRNLVLATREQHEALTDASVAAHQVQQKVIEIDRQAAAWPSIRDRVRAADHLSETVQDSARQVQQMNARTEQIGRIVQTIEAIAAQTNLLALNAAIEAARAGEHGRGFAVVADEVRKLAEGSATSAKEITQLVDSIQRDSTEAVAAMDRTLTEAHASLAVAGDAAKALEVISTAASGAAQVNQNLTVTMGRVASCSEQTLQALNRLELGLPEVETAIDRIVRVTEENSAGSQELSATTEQMSAQVEELVANMHQMDANIADLWAVSESATQAANLGRSNHQVVVSTYSRAA